MRVLARRGLRAVHMRYLQTAMNAGDAGGLIGVTFDDAYDDFLYAAVPVLKRFDFSATVFAVTGMMGGSNSWKHHYNPRPRKRLLTAEELREALNQGMEVGAHSMSHAELLDLSKKQLQREVYESGRLLAEALGSKVEGFCYPYGWMDDSTVKAVRDAGYTYACGVHTPTDRDVYNLPRIPMSDTDGPLRFAVKLKAYSQYEKFRSVAYPHYARLKRARAARERRQRPERDANRTTNL
jgi:peptidoglycan/xylan/chitin deacetylase (PgdA/CDA1 family)